MGKSYMIQCRGLPWSCTDEELKRFFGEKGIDYVDIPKRGGRATGEGVACFNNEEDYKAALTKDRQYLGTRYVEVYPLEAAPRRGERGEDDRHGDRRRDDRFERDRGGFNGFGPGNDGPNEGIVRLRGLPFNVHHRQIYEFFLPLPIVRNGILLSDTKRASKNNGEAFVVFEDPESAKLALQRHMKNIEHRYIEVFLAPSDQMLDFCKENGIRPPAAGGGGGGDGGGGGPRGRGDYGPPPFINGPPRGPGGPAPFRDGFDGPPASYRGDVPPMRSAYDDYGQQQQAPMPPPRRDDPYPSNAPAYPDPYDRAGGPPRQDPYGPPGRWDSPQQRDRDYPYGGQAPPPPQQQQQPGRPYESPAARAAFQDPQGARGGYPPDYERASAYQTFPRKEDPDMRRDDPYGGGYAASFEQRGRPVGYDRDPFTDNWRSPQDVGGGPGGDPYDRDRLRQPYHQSEPGPMRRRDDDRDRRPPHRADPYGGYGDRPQQQPPPRGYEGNGYGNGGGGPGGPSKYTLRMRGIPFKAAEAELFEDLNSADDANARARFNKHDLQFFYPTRPTRIEIMREPGGRPSGEARVEFGARDEYDDALLKDKQYLGSRYIELFPDYGGRY